MEPQEAVAESIAASWTAPTVIVPLGAAVLALLGVLLSNWWNGRNAIRAEDRRHVNELERQERQWHRHEVNALYREIIRVALQTQNALDRVVTKRSPRVASQADRSARVIVAGEPSAEQRLESHAAHLVRLWMEVRAIGSARVADLTIRCSDLARTTEAQIDHFYSLSEDRLDSIEDMEDAYHVFLSQFEYREIDSLVDAIRAELIPASAHDPRMDENRHGSDHVLTS